MGLFHRKKKKFDVVEKQDQYTLENSDGVKIVDHELNIFNYFDVMMDDDSQHIILTSPAAINHIRYIQAVRVDSQIEVQLGVEENDSTVLYHKYCTEQEARNIFIDFYHGSFQPNRKEYKLVEFM